MSAATGYRLEASAAGVTGAVSGAFDVAVGGISALASEITVSTATVVEGATVTLTLTARDAQGNRIEVHGRGEGELIGNLATLRLDAWLAPSAQYEPGGGKNAMGGEAALTLRIPGTPAALQLGYSADRARFADDEDEVVETLRFSLVLDRIQRGRPSAP